MKKLTALLLLPSAIVLIAGCRSPNKQMPVDGIRQIETIEMTAARVGGAAKEDRTARTPKQPEVAPTSDPAPAMTEASEDLLPPDPGPMTGPELDAEGDWVEGELPGLPPPVARFGDVTGPMGNAGAADITEEVIGEWRSVGGAASPNDYTVPAPFPAPARATPATPATPAAAPARAPQTRAPMSSTERAAKARAEAEARIAAQDRAAASRPSPPPPRSRVNDRGAGASSASTAANNVPTAADYPEGELPDFTVPDKPFEPSFLPIPSFGTGVETDGGPAAVPGPFPDVSVGKAAALSETIMVGSRPVTLNFVNGEWVGPQGETYSQLPIVGELLPRYGN